MSSESPTTDELYEATLDNLFEGESSGNVEAPTGWFAKIKWPGNDKWYLIICDATGFKYSTQGEQDEIDQAYVHLEEIYSKWYEDPALVDARQPGEEWGWLLDHNVFARDLMAPDADLVAVLVWDADDATKACILGWTEMPNTGDKKWLTVNGEIIDWGDDFMAILGIMDAAADANNSEVFVQAWDGLGNEVEPKWANNQLASELIPVLPSKNAEDDPDDA